MICARTFVHNTVMGKWHLQGETPGDGQRTMGSRKQTKERRIEGDGCNGYEGLEGFETQVVKDEEIQRGRGQKMRERKREREKDDEEWEVTVVGIRNLMQTRHTPLLCFHSVSSHRVALWRKSSRVVGRCFVCLYFGYAKRREKCRRFCSVGRCLSDREFGISCVLSLFNMKLKVYIQHVKNTFFRFAMPQQYETPQSRDSSQSQILFCCLDTVLSIIG